jgi:hypothetical protein
MPGEGVRGKGVPREVGRPIGPPDAGQTVVTTWS